VKTTRVECNGLQRVLMTGRNPRKGGRMAGAIILKRCPLVTVIVLAALCQGCVTNGRRILLKEYGPSIAVPADAPALKGVRIGLGKFTSAPDLVTFKPKGEPEEPRPFQYVPFSRDQHRLWADETKALQEKQKHPERSRQIGNMRNGFGIVMSHVYALNDPADWIRDGLKYDLEAQGATVVDAADSPGADVQVSGTIRLLRADMYLTVGATLVVDLELKPGAGEERSMQVHTHGWDVGLVYSEDEYLYSFRAARQKFSLLVAREIREMVAAQK
jgi:hypothetical protein